jgi:hypothetical protein
VPRGAGQRARRGAKILEGLVGEAGVSSRATPPRREPRTRTARVRIVLVVTPGHVPPAETENLATARAALDGEQDQDERLSALGLGSRQKVHVPDAALAALEERTSIRTHLSMGRSDLG